MDLMTPNAKAMVRLDVGRTSNPKGREAYSIVYREWRVNPVIRDLRSVPVLCVC